MREVQDANGTPIVFTEVSGDLLQFRVHADTRYEYPEPYLNTSGAEAFAAALEEWAGDTLPCDPAPPHGSGVGHYGYIGCRGSHLWVQGSSRDRDCAWVFSTSEQSVVDRPAAAALAVSLRRFLAHRATADGPSGGIEDAVEVWDRDTAHAHVEHYTRRCEQAEAVLSKARARLESARLVLQSLVEADQQAERDRLAPRIEALASKLPQRPELKSGTFINHPIGFHKALQGVMLELIDLVEPVHPSPEWKPMRDAVSAGRPASTRPYGLWGQPLDLMFRWATSTRDEREYSDVYFRNLSWKAKEYAP